MMTRGFCESRDIKLKMGDRVVLLADAVDSDDNPALPKGLKGEVIGHVDHSTVIVLFEGFIVPFHLRKIVLEKIEIDEVSDEGS